MYLQTEQTSQAEEGLVSHKRFRKRSGWHKWAPEATQGSAGEIGGLATRAFQSMAKL